MLSGCNSKADKVIERKVDLGQHASPGDTLLVLDIGDFELALRCAKHRVSAMKTP